MRHLKHTLTGFNFRSKWNFTALPVICDIGFRWTALSQMAFLLTGSHISLLAWMKHSWMSLGSAWQRSLSRFWRGWKHNVGESKDSSMFWLQCWFGPSATSIWIDYQFIWSFICVQKTLFVCSQVFQLQGEKITAGIFPRPVMASMLRHQTKRHQRPGLWDQCWGHASTTGWGWTHK